jgi:mRNA-degrading endonuclease RelE of RelBE toxin-antitoxin system
MANNQEQWNLTKSVLEYQKTGEEAEKVRAECCLYVFHLLQKYSILDEDMKQELFLSFLPYLEKIIESFSFRGIPFEVFLKFILKRRVKSLLRCCRRTSLVWDVTRDRSFAQVYFTDEESPCAPHGRLATVLGIGPDGMIMKKAARKRFLVWAFTQSRNLSLTDIAAISGLTGYREEWVAEKVTLLKESLLKKEARLEKLSERRNCLFFKARLLEMRIQRELDADTRAVLVAKLAKKRVSLANVMKKISHIPLNPSHRMIARVLGMPKGSIDTSFARLKQLLQRHTLKNLPCSA